MSPHAIRCRCSDECKAANRAYHIQRKQQRYAHTQEHGLPEGVEHGAWAYANWGCRCDICVTGNAETSAVRMREWRKRR